MRQTFSITEAGVRRAWNVEKLWEVYAHVPAQPWCVPTSFEQEWVWGASHIAEHVTRSLDADLAFPILVWQGNIVDGAHRVVKALATGQEVRARVLESLPPPDEETAPRLDECLEGVPWTHGDVVAVVRAVLAWTAR